MFEFQMNFRKTLEKKHENIVSTLRFVTIYEQRLQLTRHNECDSVNGMIYSLCGEHNINFHKWMICLHN